MPDNLTELIKVDIGIFAYNEADSIAALISDLGKQSVISDRTVDLRVILLANGCTDDTVNFAKRAHRDLTPSFAKRFEILDFEQGGKSRTGHTFIHKVSRKDTELLIFMDGDIELPDAGTLSQMIAQMRLRKELKAYTSRPIKDVTYHNTPVGFIGRMVALGAGGLSDYRKSICGQLFAIRTSMARQIGLPVGLPVEDGFFRAMILTDLLSAQEDLDRIDGDENTFHVYGSIRSLTELIHHQTRIVVGSAVNAVLFRKIRREAPTQEQAHMLLMQAAEQDKWLSKVLQEDLPKAPYGYVPFDFLYKRLLAKRGSRSPKAWVMLVLGFGLDALVYLLASIRMMRQKAADHW